MGRMVIGQSKEPHGFSFLWIQGTGEIVLVPASMEGKAEKLACHNLSPNSSSVLGMRTYSKTIPRAHQLKK